METPRELSATSYGIYFTAFRHL